MKPGLIINGQSYSDIVNVPYFLDHIIVLPEEIQIEHGAMSNDCTTVGPPPHSDDD